MKTTADLNKIKTAKHILEGMVEDLANALEYQNSESPKYSKDGFLKMHVKGSRKSLKAVDALLKSE